ncbi:MAG: helix-turn-helix transcriptional regulator [Clostridia bacterium]|nr:helix-turn-helix transcriptional regulator [Clostridia bacterium]
MDFFKNKILTLNSYEKGLLSAIIEEGSSAYGETMSEVICPCLPENKSETVGSDQIIKQNLELLLLSLIKNNQSVKTQKNQPEPVRYEHSENLVEGIRAYVKDNLCRNITLDDIANEFYFSKTYIKTVFRQKTGKSIIKYVIELKIEQGKKLISQGRYSITEIAYKLGFSSLHYFSRLFKLYTRMTPTEYARRIKLDKVL